MTRKDYQLIAEALARVQRLYGRSKSEIWNTIVYEFCVVLANENPNFNKAKFLKACELALPSSVSNLNRVIAAVEQP